MPLTRQLVLVSTLTLILPWAGLQFIAEMEASLRDAQTRAMKASAQAIAKLMASDADYLAQLSFQLPHEKSKALYAHPLLAAPILDGYDDEWRSYPFVAEPLGERDSVFSADFQLAYFSGVYYGFLRVKDPNLRYHNPSKHVVASGDHVQIFGVAENGTKSRYLVSASAPGKAQVYLELSPGKYRQEHRIKAYWQESAGGYQLEFQLPESSFGNRLALSVVDAGAGVKHISTQPNDELSLIVRQLDTLKTVLEVFVEQDQRIYLLSLDQWLLADSGEFAGQRIGDDFDFTDSQNNHYQWLWRFLIAQPNFSVYQDPSAHGNLVNNLISGGELEALPSAQWFTHRGHLVARAIVPIPTSNNQTIGYVVVEQAADTNTAGSANALWRLLGYSLFSVFIIGIVLLGYASWLSWRVKRLSRGVEAALGEKGAIKQSLPENTRQDELGQLSRSFSSVLGQLHEYTSYLRTLSSKLSHELRTPLAVVKTSLDNLQHESDLPQRELYTQRAHAGAERLSSILNAMSAASRLEESLGHAEMEFVQLDQLIKELGLAYSDSFDRPIDVEIGAVDCTVELVPDLIVQLLDKLVDNAVDFCPPDGKILLQLARENAWVVLTVSNDGPCLPSAMKHQLFDSLVSLRESGSAKPHLGLGLFIVRLIVEHHKGHIQAENRADGTGVYFRVFLPVN